MDQRTGTKSEARHGCLDPDIRWNRNQSLGASARRVEQAICKRTDRQTQGGKAEKVERLAAAMPSLVDEDQDADCGEDPERPRL